MVPLHESDLDEKRYQEKQWFFLELWEKVEKIERKRRGFLLILTCFLIFILVAIPVFQSRKLIWKGKHGAVQLRQGILGLVAMATDHRRVVWFEVSQNNGSSQLLLTAFDGYSCELESGIGMKVYQAPFLTWVKESHAFQLLDSEGFSKRFCYDSRLGWKGEGEQPFPIRVGFLAKRHVLDNGFDVDRVSMVVIEGVGKIPEFF